MNPMIPTLTEPTTPSIHPSAIPHTADGPPDRDGASSVPGGVHGGPRRILRLEGLMLLVLATAAYGVLARSGAEGPGWGTYAALFFAPDLAFLGYLAGPRAGAAAYNTTHSLLGPSVLGVTAALLASQTLGAAALLWAAHVGFDRALGYGLKYASAFGHTHLGVLGRRARPDGTTTARGVSPSRRGVCRGAPRGAVDQSDVMA